MATLTENGSLGLTVFLRDGVPSAVPAAAYPQGVLGPDVPYSLTMFINGFGGFPNGFFFGRSNPFSLNITMYLQGRWCAECAPQLNPLASATGQPDILVPVPAQGTLFAGIGAMGLPVLSEQLTLPFTPWGPPFVPNYWLSPDLSLGAPTIQINLTSPGAIQRGDFSATFAGNPGTAIFLGPVPEPERYAMLALGLTALLLTTNRRKKR